MSANTCLRLMQFIGIILLVNSSSDNNTENEIQTRIVGGYIARLTQFPHQVLLELASKVDYTICGGSLLNEEWILTAGHCLDLRIEITVHLGAYKLYDIDKEKGRIKYKTTPSDWILHEKYIRSTLENDIGIIKLPEKVKFGPTIKQITLKAKYEEYGPNASPLLLCGWGVNSFTKPTSQRSLKFGFINTLPKSECITLVSGIGTPNKNVICGRGQTGEVGAYGDSGGPVLNPKTRVQVGILSFIHRTTGATISLDITYYIDWLRSKVGTILTQ